MGDKRRETDDRKLKTGDKRQETGGRRRGTGEGRQETRENDLTPNLKKHTILKKYLLH